MSTSNLRRRYILVYKRGDKAGYTTHVSDSFETALRLQTTSEALCEMLATRDKIPKVGEYMENWRQYIWKRIGEV